MYISKLSTFNSQHSTNHPIQLSTFNFQHSTINFQLLTFNIQLNIKNMISEKLQAAINAQINAEMWSAYLYLSMSAYCQDAGLPGMANWYAVQFKEEQDHAMILFNYLQSRGGRVLLEPIAAVDTEWASPLATFEHTLAHEGKVTSLINNLMALAVEEKDFALQSRLNWFVDEQVEEEENASDLVHKLRLIGDNGYGLYQLDQELAARVYTQASPLTTAE